jgi:hypothetical protein
VLGDGGTLKISARSGILGDSYEWSEQVFGQYIRSSDLESSEPDLDKRMRQAWEAAMSMDAGQLKELGSRYRALQEETRRRMDEYAN